jgi:enterobactin synthetase component D
VLVSCAFDPAQLAPDDFQRAGIVPSASLQRSVAKRQAEYLAGRVCARAALQRLDGRDYVPGTHEDRSPIWPPASMARSPMAGLGRRRGRRRRRCQGLGLDQEACWMTSAPSAWPAKSSPPPSWSAWTAASGLTVTLTFSLKESLFKTLYPLTRQRFYFEHAEVLEWSAEGLARLRLLTDLSAQWRHGAELQGQFCRRTATCSA